jgi:electron transfer flavoprotein beta subunit
MGVDRAILLTDRKLGGADTLATSNALAGALRNIEHDLIITGRQAIDGDTAQVGPQIAEHLDLPQVSYLENLEYDGKKTFTIRKQTEEGYQMLEVDAPCLVTVLAPAFKARYMSVSGIVEAYGREVEVWGADKIDVADEKIGKAGSPTSVAKAFPKSLKPAGEQYDVDPEQAVGIIVSKLKEKFII